MRFSRRAFLTTTAGAGGLLLAGSQSRAAVSHEEKSTKDRYGCLVDLTLCVGCRKCEAACNEANKLPPPEKSFEDKTVLDENRRPDKDAFTVVNRYDIEGQAEPVYNKFQCMHCEDPACASACIVGALKKESNGAVTYDADKCLGCRYCMVACPFQVPAYEYDNALAPRVRKCEFCFERVAKKGEVPACVKICPKEAITFGPRDELIALAKSKIARGTSANGGKRYLNHIYGEKEVGGTDWLYLSHVPFEDIGFLKLPEKAPPRLTESIQHGIFKYFAAPISLFAFLGGAMRLFGENDEENAGTDEEVRS